MNKEKLNRCYIIGVLDNAMLGLTAMMQVKLAQADLVIASTRVIELFKGNYKKDCELFDLTAKFSSLPDKILSALAANKQVVVLATGDPLCHGIGSFLAKKLASDQFEIVPNVSMIQLAFAHLGEPWQEAKIASIHGVDTKEWQSGSGCDHKLYALLQQIKQHSLLFIYTSPVNSPQRIARLLINEKIAQHYEFSIFEKLLQKDQHIHLNMSCSDVSQNQFLSPNVIILKRKNKAQEPLLFGYDDDFYAKRTPKKGLITRADVRAVVLAKMQLKKDSVVWDIGAGSGSVGLEAAMLCSKGFVYAIEKNCDDLTIIESNRVKMGLTNYSVICAKAPDKLAQWPAPDAVFIGGSAGQLAPLFELVVSKLNPKGHLILNFITLENLNESLQLVKQQRYENILDWELIQLQTSHSKPILNMSRMQADNPVWILSIKKRASEHE